MIWFTADTHVGHTNIIKHCDRPFVSVEEMDRTLVKRWNAVVDSGDVVYHLGDFAYRCDPEHALGVALEMNGVKHLVPGGHDHCKTGRILNGVFRVVDPLVMVRGEGHPPLVLCHYPLASWWGSGRGSIMLHGHSHGRMPAVPRRVDVGVDSWGFRPVSLDEVLEAAR